MTNKKTIKALKLQYLAHIGLVLVFFYDKPFEMIYVDAFCFKWNLWHIYKVNEWEGKIINNELIINGVVAQIKHKHTK